MKKQQSVKMFYVLTSDEKEDVYSGNKVIATGTKELLEQYKKQLIDNGYDNVFTIEEKVYDGWSSGIRFNGYNLVEHEGLLYPKKNIDFAQDIVNKQLSTMRNLHEGLTELKEVFIDKEQHYNEVLKTIEQRFEDIKNQKLEIKML